MFYLFAFLKFKPIHYKSVQDESVADITFISFSYDTCSIPLLLTVDT